MSHQGPAGRFNNFVQNMNKPSGPNAQIQQLKTLRCVFCNMDKPLDAFSSTQIQKATYNPYAPPSYNNKKKTIRCKKCTPTQTTHLTCMVCSKTQPLDKFAKSQRKNAEKARCLKCIKKREEEDVWASDPDTDSEDDFEAYF
ncbi:Stc1 domain-containing protein [Cokeromyces recurvatus]|uniref:Stc1 domain-containing protein n=1 Tax=Cokeromyces recurvatus TaxID=90255 RepID=UPI00221F1D69|nr:Stc1 domain-containing protein [Cokeromyces recurvatus]KAI7908059.1 Stc1 domain-containing protein [Cokeromyces recurvatus]